MQNKIDALANKISNWIGSTVSLILHTLFFVFTFVPLIFGFSIQTVLLCLTTVLSLEAIYLSLFIQRTMNIQSHKITEEFQELEEVIEEQLEEEPEEIKRQQEMLRRMIRSELSKVIDEKLKRK